MTRMIIGKYIRMLLEERKRVILAGFGNLELKQAEGAEPPSGNRISPPGITVRFDTGFSKDDGLLAGALAAGESLEQEEAHQRVLELVDAIKFALDKGEEYLLHDAGTFSRDADGKIRFLPDPSWVLEPDQYGLESMDLLELEELPKEEAAAVPAATQDPVVTPLATPAPRSNRRRWRVIWLVAVLLIVVLAVLVLIPAEEGEDGTDRRRFFNRQPDREVVKQDKPAPEIQDAETTGQNAEPEVVEPLPVESVHTYFVIAGSFKNLKNASDLQDQLNGRGFQAEVMITENRMYRVSVASYATKAEAEKGLYQITSEPGLQSCWLLSN